MVCRPFLFMDGTTQRTIWPDKLFLSLVTQWSWLQQKNVILILFVASLSEPWIHEGQEAVYIYVYIFVCLWGDHFSEEGVKFKQRIGIGRHAHLFALWQTLQITCKQRHETGNSLARLRSRVNVAKMLYYYILQFSLSMKPQACPWGWLDSQGINIIGLLTVYRYINSYLHSRGASHTGTEPIY